MDLSNLLVFLEGQNYQDLSILTAQLSEFLPPGVRFVYENSPLRLKLLFYVMRGKADFSIPLVQQCNGLILLLDEQGCRVLSCGISEFAARISHGLIAEYIHQELYDIFEIRDGTILHLYYDERWMWSTRKSLDIANVSWRGCTYQSVIEECLQKCPQFALEKLNPQYSYVVGLTHPAFHPFSNRIDMWLVRAFSLQTQTVVKVDLPQAQCYSISEFMENFGKLSSALNDFLESQEIFLGYILRAKKPGTVPDYLMQSTLWNEIKKCIYQLPHQDSLAGKEVRERNFVDMRYVVLLNFLAFSRHTIFIKLFPQFGEDYKFLEGLVRAVVDYFLTELIEVPCGKKKVVLPKIYKTLALEIHGRLRSSIDNHYRAGRQNYDHKVLRDLICCPQNANIFYDVLCSPSVKWTLINKPKGNI